MRFILVISLLCSTALFAQESLFNHFSTKDGLISNEVYDVLQDDRGSIWFATNKGISKLQGFDFQSYSKSDGFESEPFIGLYQSSNSEIWAYTSLGRLYRFTGSDFKPIALNRQIERIWGGRIVNSFTADQSGNLYLSSVFPGNPIQINRSTKTVSKIGISEKMRFFILEVDEGKLLNGSLNSTGGNGVVVHTSESSFKVNLGGAVGFTKSDLYKRSGGSFLFSAGSEVIDFNSEGIKSRLFTEKNIECVFEDSEGKVWVGLNQGGLLCFPEGDIASLNKFEYLGKKTVTDIYEDGERNLWFSTSDNGVYQMSLTPQIVYTPPVINSGASGDSIREVVGITQGSTANEIFLSD